MSLLSSSSYLGLAFLSLVLCHLSFAVLGQSSGDTLALTAVPRPAVVNLNFSVAPSVATNWAWAASDPSDSPTAAAIHQGVARLNGATNSYIDISANATAAQGAYGQTLPSPFGGAGFNGGGWSVEMVVKFPTTSENLAACLFLFQDFLGTGNSWMTITTGNTYDAGDVDTPNRLQATISNNQANTGVMANGTGSSIEFFAPNNNTWYHIVWTVQPFNGVTSGQGVWQFYVNGVLLNYADILFPNSTFAPIQGAAYPQASTRNVANIGKDSGSNYYQMNIDAFRVYDYLLTPSTVVALATAYQMYAPQPTPVSYPFPASAEGTSARALVPTAPIFSATFSVSPTTAPAIPYINYGWAAADPADSPLMQALHPGVIFLNGSATSYVNVQQASGPQSCGLVLPIFGLPGSGTAGVNQGLTFEVVFKYPTGFTLTSGEKIFDFGQGGLDTWDWAYQGSQIEFETQNNVGPTVSSFNRVAPYLPSPGTFTVGVWHHVVMVLSNPLFTNYSSQWTIYVNGSQVATVPAGIYPLPIYRPLSYFGGADYNNPNLPLTLDAFRIYDYALTATTVASLYNSLYNPATAQPGSTGAAPVVSTGGAATSGQAATSVPTPAPTSTSSAAPSATSGRAATSVPTSVPAAAPTSTPSATSGPAATSVPAVAATSTPSATASPTIAPTSAVFTTGTTSAPVINPASAAVSTRMATSNTHLAIVLAFVLVALMSWRL